MRRRLPGIFAVGVAGMILTCSCTGAYFRKAERPPPSRGAVVEWPVRDHWTGIVFNGARIGFAHFTMSPSPGEKRLYDIRSEAYLKIRFLWMDKIIHLVSFDRVHADLSLQHFHYVYNIDGSRMTIDGQMRNGTLVYTLHTRGQTTDRNIVLERAPVPASATGLYPLLNGLRIGNRHRYEVFDGQSQRVGTFDQAVAAYEESDLFSGPAFKVISRYLGQKVTTWMDSSGNPLLEMSMGGVIIAVLEDEATARSSLARAALNKQESLIEFSRIRSDRIIPDSHRVTFMQVHISGIQNTASIPSDFRQNCRRSGDAFICAIHVRAEPKDTDKRNAAATNSDIDLERYLQPTTAISARHPRIQKLASELAPASANQWKRIRSIIEWQQANIRQEPVDVFTALDVLETGKAECQGHSLLFAALARSSGIPTRIVNGIVYVAAFEGFLYHSWNESYVNGSWVAIDPTFGQAPADATHVKLVEGHSLADLTPLLQLIGRIQIEVVAYK